MGKETANAVFQDLLVEFGEALDDFCERGGDEIDVIVSKFQGRWDSIERAID